MLTCPEFETHQRLQSQYRAYHVIGNKVLIQGEPKIVVHGDPPLVPKGVWPTGQEPGPNTWVLLDLDNGNPEGGFGYCWIFRTRQEARQHRDRQNANEQWAKVSGPWRIAAAKEYFLFLSKQRLRGRLQRT